MDPKKYIAVFCASSPKISAKYFEAATKASSAIIDAGYGIIYGGGSNGLMGAVADKALELNGSVKGVIPRFMVEVEWQHKKVEDMVLVETMHQRKELMVKNSTGILALPGGIGTLEELFEVLSLKKLGQYSHPVILLNTDGYFDGLIQLFKKMTDENFMRSIHNQMWSIVNTPEEIVDALKNASPWGKDAINFAAL